MKVRKKILYYILSAIAVALTCSFGPLFDDGDGMVSVIGAIVTCSKDRLSEYTIFRAFNSGMTGTIDMLLPVCCAVPSASYIYDEIKSGMFPYIHMRRGRYRYIYSAYAYSAISGAATVMAGLITYIIFLSFFFHFGAGGAAEPEGMSAIITQTGFVVINKMMYGAAMAVCASFLIYMYANLYFVLSVLFIISYAARDIFYVSNISYFIATLAVMAVLYGIMWRYRSERI